MIEKNIQKWYQLIKGDFPGGYDELLADDVIFYSPVVFTPQKGKDLAKLYLMAAGNTFGGDESNNEGELKDSSFHYMICLVQYNTVAEKYYNHTKLRHQESILVLQGFHL